MTFSPRLVLIFACVLIFGCDQLKTEDKGLKNTSSSEQTTTKAANEFLITIGFIDPEIDTVTFFKYEEDGLVALDSVNINNQFAYKGTIDAPSYFAVKTNKDDSVYKFLVDASYIDLFISENIKNSSTYSNSELQTEYRSFNKNITNYKNRGVGLYYDLKGDFSNKSITKLRSERSKLFAEQADFKLNFIKNNPSSFLSALLIEEQIDFYTNNTLRELYNNLSDSLKDIAAVKLIDSAIINKETYVETKLPIVPNTSSETKTYEEYRPKAYSLSGKNQYGETLSLNSIPSGKVILLDFWASWCGPCRASNPNLVALYNKYNAAGLEIMSISEDKGEAEWMTAINTDNLNWDYHIIDKNKTIAFRYGVESIPFKLLIDKKGRVASEKISGRKLEQRIKELLAE